MLKKAQTMQIAKSNSRLHSIALFIVIYTICQAIVFFVHPVWQLMKKLSFFIDDLLNTAKIALADGEFDPAGLWVIFGVPLCKCLYYFLPHQKN
ncbi:hypothetical protein [Snodgrassella alvi]|uniref:Uncharacterized protein n=1 Tax=Snodgrassella alvi TaxID=1196083 RepID=A0A2N9WTM9_9NEIS|nr:hypothetical protein [Snodgrassella alvi]PIT14991.1 hypothetical protein BGI32_06450 [Snodgrassella alvi]PIT15753.1 hypothetical protein BGI34_11125 [Snodgrassella alvi]PIT18904.1 hypothetical protein BGI33_00050 [Snodgrassella alvi]